jgi:formylglycine-generating enzyme required for sulfatase activity/serine/threonine protein kinase
MPPQTVSHYRLTELLGSGTYGEVWKGVHQDDPSFVVAVKLVSSSMQSEPSFIAALRQECRSLDTMDHPSIVRFRDLVVRDGVVAMVLELLDGEDLEAALAAGPQQVGEVVRILELALDGLAYAHGRGVLHRDIKPGNLYRCRDGRVKLMDFGLARAADGSSGTKTGTLKGTLDYMAPERFRNVTTAAADVYALGLVAWELLAGRRAAPDGDLPAKLGWHLTEGAPDVRTVRPDCPAWLAEVVSAMTSIDPSKRPSDGAEAQTMLRAARVAGLGASSPPSTPPSRPAMPGTVEVRVPAQFGAPQSAPPSSNPPRGGVAGVAPHARPSVPGTVVLSGMGAPAAGSPSPRAAPSVHRAAPSAPPSGSANRPSSAEDEDDEAPQPRSSSGPFVGALVAGALIVVVVVVAMQGGSDDDAAEAGPPAVAAGSSGGEVAPSGYALRLVPAGTYQVGCTAGQRGGCEDDEKPSRSVTLSRSVLMGETEVTQGLYSQQMGRNPSEFNACGLACPVEMVSWFDAVAFANKLSESEGLESCYVIRGETVTWPNGVSCLGYRLPTEAEWEVSARGGRDDKYAGGGDLSAVGWFDGNSGGTTHPVGQKQANGYGLYDMSGNVWEWSWDWYDSSTYSIGAEADPAGPASGSLRVRRGGGWYYDPQSARVALRDYSTPGHRGSILGFRLLRTAP